MGNKGAKKSMKAHFYMQYNFLTTVDFAILTTLFFSKASVAVRMTPKMCISMHYLKSYMFKVKSAGKKRENAITQIPTLLFQFWSLYFSVNQLLRLI